MRCVYAFLSKFLLRKNDEENPQEKKMFNLPLYLQWFIVLV